VRETGDALPGARLVASLGRDDEVRDVADTRERLAAKAVGAERRQVLERLDLGRGESLAEDRQVVFLQVVAELGESACDHDGGKSPRSAGRGGTHPDAAAVVLDLEELEAAVLDRDADAGCACVERVLDELLERVGRALDDLQGG